MRFQLFTILFLFSSFQAIWGQNVNFEDGFNDGDFSHNPMWSGDTENFTITDIEENPLLQLNAGGSGTSYLSTPSSNIEGSWEFYIKLDFAPSGGNRAYIFLVSDTSDLSALPNGYAIRAGESGSDDRFHLVRFSNGSEDSTLISGTTDISGGGEYRVKITRDSDSNWTLETGLGYNGELLTEGTARGSDQKVNATHLGVLLNYTSTRSDKFYFDFKIDFPPFSVTDVSVNGSEIDVTFNRNYDQSTIQSDDFLIDNGYGSPDFVSFVNEKTIRIGYGNMFPSGKYTLSLSTIKDENGEITSPDQKEFYVFDIPSIDDVVINEFMYDPPAGLEEYVELKNNSEKYINLQNWQIGDDSNYNTISLDTLVFEPGNYLVISRDTSSLFNMFGDRLYIEITVPFLNNNKDAVQIIDDKGVLVDSLFFTSDWGGDDVALERRSAETNSVFRENWGNSPDSLGGTPGEENKTEPDRKAPGVSDVIIPSSRTIRLVFDERVNRSTAESRSNYTIDEITVNTVQQTAPDTVEVSLSSNLENAVTYNLDIKNISDIFGNAISNFDTSFTYYKISPVEPGDIAINEFMYDPPANSTEYVEIYNYSDKSLNLDGWIISDNRDISTFITSTHFILPPESYLVLAPDNTLLQEFPEINLIPMGNSFPALNNGGDQIVIKNSAGTLLDSLEYTSAWGGEEAALERRSISLSGIHQSNWANSPEVIGTPGTPNKVEPDLEPPELLSLEVMDASTLQLNFSERLAVASAKNTNSYSVSPEKKIRTVSINADTVTLYLDEELDSGRDYRVTVTGLEDLFGNKMDSQIQKISYLKVSQPAARDLVINEILYKRSSGGGPEFIELYNRSDKNFILDGWMMGDAADIAILTGNILFPAGEYLVLTDDLSFSENNAKTYHVPNFPSLNDAGDILYIRNENGVTIDSLHFKSSWGDNLSGVSLERKDPWAASNDASNWVTSSNPTGNTAGRKNAGSEKDDDPPKTLFSKHLDNGNIEVHFNEFIVLTDDVEFLLGSDRLHIVEFNPAEGNKIILSSNQGKRRGINTEIAINNFSDFRGNTTESAKIAVSQRVKPGDLVINEIMYSPLSGSQDKLPDQSEYIELQNITDHAISLEGIQLHDAPDEKNNLRILTPESTDSRWIPAQSIVLIYADQSSDFKSSKIADFFDLEIEDINSPLRVDRTTLSLASTGDAIYITDSTGTAIDSVFYDESWQNPNLIDTRGIALERINPYGAGNEAGNWGSSISEKGGTPGSENSIYQKQGNASVDFGISLSPNPFSPDNDGYEDNLFINYALDASDYLIRVRIYDRYGRLVRKLRDGKPAGFGGSIIWDGRRDNGSRNRIGIYIVVVEAYDSLTGKSQAFKETVVLARRL